MRPANVSHAQPRGQFRVPKLLNIVLATKARKRRAETRPRQSAAWSWAAVRIPVGISLRSDKNEELSNRSDHRDDETKTSNRFDTSSRP